MNITTYFQITQINQYLKRLLRVIKMYKYSLSLEDVNLSK
jgi:hypothetical protein